MALTVRHQVNATSMLGAWRIEQAGSYICLARWYHV